MADAESDFDKLRDCPVLTTLDAMGGKWKTRILWHLRGGASQFGDLQRSMQVSEKVLTENLKALQRANIILREEVKVAGVITTEYDYTPYGRSLIPVLDAMGNWGISHRSRTQLSSGSPALNAATPAKPEKSV